MINNFLTFDVEEWYHANFQGMKFTSYDGINFNLELMVDKIIDICGELDIKSTCFILGEIALQKPQIVKKLYSSGHEIASHAFNHNLIYKLTPEQFRSDLVKSIDILSGITGDNILGFRAPSWSVNKNTSDWFYDILKEQGILYSSSVYPGKTKLFGFPGFGDQPVYPIIDGKKSDILEIPLPMMSILGRKSGFSGGSFFRIFPKSIIENQIRNKNESGLPVVLYLHPRELDPYQQRLDLKFNDKIIHYWGLKGCEKKFRSICSKYRDTFIPMIKFVNEFKSND